MIEIKNESSCKLTICVTGIEEVFLDGVVFFNEDTLDHTHITTMADASRALSAVAPYLRPGPSNELGGPCLTSRL
jgi:hypothetical protein